LLSIFSPLSCKCQKQVDRTGGAQVFLDRKLILKMDSTDTYSYIHTYLATATQLHTYTFDTTQNGKNKNVELNNKTQYFNWQFLKNL
jgi:hypothetical protein